MAQQFFVNMYLYMIMVTILCACVASDQTCDIQQNATSISVDCSNRNLSQLPCHLPMNMTYLDISNNGICCLYNGSFESYQSLEFLNISNIGLTVVEQDTFTGLTNLQVLDISGNRGINKPDFLFRDLVSLKYLRTDYLGFLSHLDTLHEVERLYLSMYVTIENKTIHMPEQFTALRNLSRLDIELVPVNHIPGFNVSITSESFQNIPSKKLLSLLLVCHSFILKHIGLNSFSQFYDLMTLVISDCSFVKLEDTLNAVRSSNLGRLDTLVLDHMQTMLKKTPTVLKSAYINSTSFYGLKRLSLRRVNIDAIEINVFEVLKELNYLSLGYNTIKFVVPVQPGWIKKAAIVMQKSMIQTLDLSSLESSVIGPEESIYIGFDVESYFRKPLEKYNLPKCNATYTRNVTVPDNATESDLINKYFFPRICIWYIDHIKMTKQSIHKNTEISPYNLTFVDASFSDHASFFTRYFYNLPKLTVFVCRQCVYDYHPELVPIYLENNSTIEWFILESSNIIPNMFYLFKAMPYLKHLDISKCGLKEIPYDSFRVNHLLESINLEGNSLHSLDVSLRFLSQLTFLGLSSNFIEDISIETMRDVITLNQKQPHVLLDITNNSFRCNCNNAEFIKLFQLSNFTASNKSTIACTLPYEHNKVVDISSISMFNFWIQCHLTIIIAIPLASFLLIAIVATGIVFKIKKVVIFWRLHKRRQNDRFPNFTGTQIEDCRYHAMILYNCQSEEDRNWVQDNLLVELENIFNQDRIYDAGITGLGQPIDNIVEHLDKCATCIVVLSPDFVDTMENYGMLLVLSHVAYILKDIERVILVDFKHIDEGDLRALPYIYRLMYHEDQYVLRWSPEGGNQAAFYEALCRRIPCGIAEQHVDNGDQGIVVYDRSDEHVDNFEPDAQHILL